MSNKIRNKRLSVYFYYTDQRVSTQRKKAPAE